MAILLNVSGFVCLFVFFYFDWSNSQIYSFQMLDELLRHAVIFVATRGQQKHAESSALDTPEPGITRFNRKMGFIFIFLSLIWLSILCLHDSALVSHQQVRLTHPATSHTRNLNLRKYMSMYCNYYISQKTCQTIKPSWTMTCERKTTWVQQLLTQELLHYRDTLAGLRSFTAVERDTLNNSL